MRAALRQHGPSRPASGRRGSEAFTLLEIVLVVLIIALAMGALIPFLGGGLENEALRKTAADFEKAARTARALAIGSGYPSEMRLEKEGFALRGYRPTTGEEESPERLDEAFAIKRPTTWQVRTWLRDRWRTPDAERWIFQPSGLVEPLTVRFTRADAYVEISFNPLTGEPERERYHFP